MSSCIVLLEKAESLGVTVINEAELLGLINN